MMSKKRTPEAGILKKLAEHPEMREEFLRRDPSLHNLFSYDLAWSQYPEALDFLDPYSPNYHLKALSWELYLRFLGPVLDTLSETSVALDAGCGIGRFTLEAARRFSKVTAFDPCEDSLDACEGHLADAGFDHVDLHLADFEWLDQLEPHSFDVIFAMEVIGYTLDPTLSLRRLVRVAKPGAKIFLSVEARPGALTVEGADSPEELVAALQGRPLCVPGDRYVTYFDSDSLVALALACGLEPAGVQGSHYFGEGPFAHSLDEYRLDDPAYFKRIADCDTLCAADSKTSAWARVFTLIADVPAPKKPE